MVMKLGEGRFDFTTNMSRFIHDMNRAEGRAHKATGRIRGSFKRLTALRMPQILGGLTAGMAIRSSIQEAMAFEEQMANVSTMVQDTGKWMGQFETGVSSLSQQFGQSTESMAGGLYDILSASVDPAQALQVLEVSARAATAGITDTKTAADAITTVLNSYGMSAEEAGSVSDLLFSIVARGKTTFAELAPNIGNVASLASNAGVSLEELGAMLAVMTRNGVKTDVAITSLASVISGFISPSKEASEMAAKLGLDLSSATIRSEGLFGVFKRISALPPEALSALFPNVRALRGLLPALQDVAGFQEDLAVMTNRAGATDIAFEKMAHTAAFQMRQAREEFHNVQRELGNSLMPVVTNAAQAFANFAKAITGANSELASMMDTTSASGERFRTLLDKMREFNAEKENMSPEVREKTQKELAEETRAELAQVDVELKRARLSRRNALGGGFGATLGDLFMEVKTLGKYTGREDAISQAQTMVNDLENRRKNLKRQLAEYADTSKMTPEMAAALAGTVPGQRFTMDLGDVFTAPGQPTVMDLGNVFREPLTREDEAAAGRSIVNAFRTGGLAAGFRQMETERTRRAAIESGQPSAFGFAAKDFGEFLARGSNMLGAVLTGGSSALAAGATAAALATRDDRQRRDLTFTDPASFWSHFAQQMQQDSTQEQIQKNTAETVKQLEKQAEDTGKAVAKSIKDFLGMGPD